MSKFSHIAAVIANCKPLGSTFELIEAREQFWEEVQIYLFILSRQSFFF